MTWKVRIICDLRDLAEIQQSFSGGWISIERTKNHEYYLVSETFQECINDKQVSKIASKLIALLSGAYRLAMGRNFSINQSETVKVNPDGSESVYMHFGDILHGRDSFLLSIIDSEGNVDEERKPTDEVSIWLEMGMKDQSVAKVLRLYTQPLDWVGLYRIYEVIENDLGGLAALASVGWAKKNKIQLFKHTSNSPCAIGDDARHGKESSQPPPQPMKLHEAKNLVKNLISAWLKNKQ
jgi:hypothetical protein